MPIDLASQLAVQRADETDGLHANYFADEAASREPFALMHHVHG